MGSHPSHGDTLLYCFRKYPTSPTIKPSRMRAYPIALMRRSVVDERPPKRKLKGVPATWGIIVEIIPRPSRRMSIPKSMVLVDPIMSLPFYCEGAAVW